MKTARQKEAETIAKAVGITVEEVRYMQTVHEWLVANCAYLDCNKLSWKASNELYTNRAERRGPSPRKAERESFPALNLSGVTGGSVGEFLDAIRPECMLDDAEWERELASRK